MSDRFVHPALMHFDLRRPLREWDDAIREWEERQTRETEERAKREATQPPRT